MHKCPKCNEECNLHSGENVECFQFLKANKIPYEEYQGEQLYDGENYQVDFDDFPELEWMWGTKKLITKELFHPILDGLLDRLKESLELQDHLDPDDFIVDSKWLNDFIWEWHEKQKHELFYPDFSVVVLPPKKEEDKS